MNRVPPDPADSSAAPAPAPDDTAAFSRYYLGDPDGPTSGASADHGLMYRLFVGWWRDR